MNVSLGCGSKKPKGFVGIDIKKFPEVDYVLDIQKDKLPFKDNSVDLIQSAHVFEHLESSGLFFCIDECFRVLKPKGRLEVSVPKAGTPAFYLHPDHKIHFTEDTFSFFQVPADGVDIHGYIKNFWHVNIVDSVSPHSVSVIMYPNKPKGKFPYKKIKLNWK